MRVLILLVLFVFRANTLFSQAVQKDLWLLKEDENGETGYVDTKGKYVIPPGTYEHCFTDTFRNYAIVADKGQGLIAIDRDRNTLFNVFNYDNGPDYISEGLFRIVGKSKVGYADKKGTIVINAAYDMGEPFSNGLAAVAQECDETLGVCKWGYINKKGIMIIPAVYEKAESFKKGRALVLKNGKSFYINKKGQALK